MGIQALRLLSKAVNPAKHEWPGSPEVAGAATGKVQDEDSISDSGTDMAAA
jgi:hypothetical protein